MEAAPSGDGSRKGPHLEGRLTTRPGYNRPPDKPASDQPGKSGPLRISTVWYTTIAQRCLDCLKVRTRSAQLRLQTLKRPIRRTLPEMAQEALQPLKLIAQNGAHLDLAVAQPVVEMHTFVHTGNARMAAAELPAEVRQELRNPAVKIPLPALFPLHLLMPRAVVVVSGRGAGPFGPATASIGAHRP